MIRNQQEKKRTRSSVIFRKVIRNCSAHIIKDRQSDSLIHLLMSSSAADIRHTVIQVLRFKTVLTD